MKTSRLVLPGALAAAALLSFPSGVSAWSLLGFALPLGQRQFRVYPTSFLDATANNNTVPHVNFPGFTGATMATWKGAVEWGSYRHGPTGAGDPTQGALGGEWSNTSVTDNPLANFDFTFQGATTTSGGSFGNVVSATQTSLGPGVLAATFLPGGTGAGGWQILFDDPQWNWDDGPSAAIVGVDIQGVACHEVGHALGLGHSAVASTMFPAISGGGVPQRSIESDDSGGIKANYGVLSATKPRITSLSGAMYLGGTLTITGTNFTATGNEVWFTSTAATGVPRKVLNLPSLNAGTQIDVVIPTVAPAPGDGDLLVKTPGLAAANLSNTWPIDIAAGPPIPPALTSIGPNPVAIVSPIQPTMTLLGTNLGGVTSVNVGGLNLTGGLFTVVSSTQINFFLPIVPSLGANSVTATNAAGTSNALTLTVNAAAPPVLVTPPFVGTGGIFIGDTFTLPGNFVFLCLSTSNFPSVIPGVLSLGLGNNFTLLFVFPPLLASAAQGRTTISFTVPGGGAGLTVYFQSVTVTPTGMFDVSNLQSVLILF